MIRDCRIEDSIKVLKVIIINIVLFYVLIGGVEFFFRLRGKKPLIRPVVIHRYSHAPLKKEEIIAEFGSEALRPLPEEVKSSFVPELKSQTYSYADIEPSPEINRQWTISKDGKSRSSLFSRKIKGTPYFLYNVHYALDPFGQRFVENQDHKTKTNQFVLAAGDSFTFGEGVEQGLDFPSQLAKLLGENVKVYNYGVAGDSANDFYLRGLANKSYFFPIQEQEGIFIWVYHEVQMQRLIFPTNAYETAPYIASKPDYTRESNGELKFHGFFNEAQRQQRKWIKALSRSAAVSALNLEIPKVYTEDNFQLFLELLDQAQYVIETKNNKKFQKKILVTFMASQQVELLHRLARERGYQVLDIEKLLEYRSQSEHLNVRIPIDEHPSSEAYWILAQALNNLLEKK